MRASTSASSASLTRSILLRMMTSAKAIWFLASGASLRRSVSHLASATVTTASSFAAHGAADAAVVHLEHFLVRADHEVVVDADLAELVDDHGVALAVRLGQDAVQKRGLAGAEIAGEDGDGDLVGHWVLRANGST